MIMYGEQLLHMQMGSIRIHFSLCPYLGDSVVRIVNLASRKSQPTNRKNLFGLCGVCARKVHGFRRFFSLSLGLNRVFRDRTSALWIVGSCWGIGQGPNPPPAESAT